VSLTITILVFYKQSLIHCRQVTCVLDVGNDNSFIPTLWRDPHFEASYFNFQQSANATACKTQFREREVNVIFNPSVTYSIERRLEFWTLGKKGVIHYFRWLGIHKIWTFSEIMDSHSRAVICSWSSSAWPYLWSFQDRLHVWKCASSSMRRVVWLLLSTASGSHRFPVDHKLFLCVKFETNATGKFWNTYI
jgi:hypothetical protein